MSWISTNTTDNKVYPKQISQDVLSFYHGFSKTPVEPEIKSGAATGYAATTLANATTKSGHTVLGSEVWASELPWFGFAPNKDVASTRVSGITNKNDLIRINDVGKDYIYIGEGGETFTKATWDTVWQEITLTNGMELANQYGDKVLRYYENQRMQALESDNNAGIDSKGYATRLFVDESTHTAVTTVGQGSVIPQFAAATDSIKNGLTSSILNPVVYIDGTQKVPGTHFYDYNVSGTILWDSNVKSKNVTITCFRYIGKSVTAKTAEIESTIEDLKIAAGAGITVTDGTKQKKGITTLTLGGSNGVTVTVNESTGAVTFGVDTATIATTASVTAISDRISQAASDITATSEKLVTGKAVYDYVSGATLNGGTQGDNQIQTATGDTANKLVTAAQVKEYVTENAQVTVTVGETNVTSTGFEFAGSTGSDVSLSAAMDSNGKVTYSATLSKATVGTDGTILTGDENKAVSATDAKTIVDKAIEGAVADGSVIDTRIDEVITTSLGATTTTGTIGKAIADVKTTADSAIKSVSGPSAGLVTVSTNSSNKAVTISVSDKLASKDDITLTGITLNGKAITPTDKVAAITAIEDIITDNSWGGLNISKENNKLKLNITPASYIPATFDVNGNVTEAGDWTCGDDLSSVNYFTLASDVRAAIKDATKVHEKDIATVTAAIESLTTSGFSREIVSTLPTTGIKLNAIYLVPMQSAENPNVNEYVEYIYVGGSVSNGVVSGGRFEQIGTTKTDLSEYAKNADVIKSIATANGVSGTVTNNVATITVQDGTTSQKGIVKLDSTIAGSTSETTAATPKAVKEYADTKVGSIQWFGENDILSTKAEIADGKLTISENELGYVDWERIPENTITKIVNNKAYSSDGTVEFVIETDKLTEAGYHSLGSQFTEFDSDLSSLKYTSATFSGTALKSFTVDMPNLVDSYNMFESVNTLEIFASDLPHLLWGGCMFMNCQKLKTFIGETPSLENGESMFYHCHALDTFIGDLSSLERGWNMFTGTILSEESVDNIADTIKENPSHAHNAGIISIYVAAWERTDNIIKSLCHIVDKGWKLETDNDTQVAIIASNPEKYQNTTGFVEVKPSAQAYGMRGSTEPVMKEIQVVCLKK